MLNFRDWSQPIKILLTAKVSQSTPSKDTGQVNHIYLYFCRIHRALNLQHHLVLFFRNKKKDELLDGEGDDKASSSSANEEQNATTDCEDVDTGKTV